MTEDRLPDDQTRWPTDPYQLLGVNANVDERGLKRAYAKLIHQFTPEHHPQQFARIRAAFEQLLVFLQWRSQFRVIETKHETTDAPAEHQPEDIPHSPQHPDSKINASRDADEPVKLPDLEIGRNEQFSAGRDPRDEPSKPINRLSSQRKVSIEEGLNEAWRTAIQGDPVQGYRQLLNLASQFEHHCEIYLRLYWLQRLFPEVDSTRHNGHWLIIALQRTEFHDSPWQLYCAELQRHPQLVHADEHQSLLDSTIPSWRLFDLLEHRWRAALQDNSWERVGSDLDRLRDKLKFDSTTTWIRVLFQAVDLAAWSGHPVARQIFQQSKDEIQELSNVQEQLIADFFRYDLLLEAMTTTPLEQLKIVDDDFPEFSRDDWQQSLDHPDPRFRSALETWVSNPRRVLKLLTGFWKHARHAFGHICRIIESLDCDQSRANAFRKRETILDTVQEFLLARKTMKYGRLRVELLEFCITNQIALDQVLSCFEDWMVFSMEKGTLAFLRKDRPLEIVLRGIFAFWK